MDLGLRDTAKLFRVSDSTVARWVKEDGLPAFLINGRYRFNRVDLLEWANRRRLPTPDLAAAASGPAGLSLEAALEAGGIHHRVPGTDVRSAMEAAVQRLPLSPADRLLAAQVLAERAAEGSTGLGDGIAIPHPRSPLVFPTDRSIASLCLLETPVDFGAADGKPVNALFLLLTPTVRLHLALLSRVAAALLEPGFRDAVIRQAPAEEIWARLKGKK